MNSIIPIATSSLVADISQFPATLFNDLLPLLVLIVGVPFGFWVIYKVVGLAKRSFSTGGRRAI